MLLAATALILISLVGLCIILAGVAGYCYGENQSRARWIRQQRKDIGARDREVRLWQDKTLMLRSAGPLQTPTYEPNPNPQRGRRFVSPSQVIADLKDKAGITPPTVSAAPAAVPEAIASKFLKDTAEAVNKTS